MGNYSFSSNERESDIHLIKIVCKQCGATFECNGDIVCSMEIGGECYCKKCTTKTHLIKDKADLDECYDTKVRIIYT